MCPVTRRFRESGRFDLLHRCNALAGWTALHGARILALPMHTQSQRGHEITIVTGMAAASRIHALLATDEHAEAIAAFYRETWRDDVTPESVLADRRRAAEENVAAPGEAPPIAIVLDGSRVIGYCGSIPQRLWDGRAEYPAYWVKGLMVLPAYRQGPIGFLVCKELTSQLPRATALVVAPAARRLFGALGYTDLGAVANFVRVLRPAALARRLDVAQLGSALPGWVRAVVRGTQTTGVAAVLAGGAGRVLDFVAVATRRSAGRFDTGAAEPPCREELDHVWRNTRAALAASSVRDGLYLRSRFGPTAAVDAGTRYTFVTAREDGRLVGLAVLREPRETGDPRLGGIRVATLSDTVFPPQRPDIGLALLGGVEREARAARSDAILCTTGHRKLASLLRRQAYVSLRGNVHFFLRDATGGTRWPRDLESWWLARGDGEADEVF